MREEQKGGFGEIRNRTEVEYGGKKYNSIHELCNELKVAYSIVCHKYERTKNIVESVEWARKQAEKKNSLILWGTQYQSYAEIAKAFGLNLGSMRARMKEETSLEEIIREMLIKETIIFQGEEYAGVSALAVAFDKDVSLVLARLSYGFNLERALFQPLAKKDNPHLRIEYQGKVYESKRHIFREIGICGSCVYELMNNHDVDFETAIDFYYECKTRMGMPMNHMISFFPVCIIREKEYRTAIQVAHDFNMAESTLATYKSRHGCMGILETLQLMQKETKECFVVEGKIKTYGELRKMGYTSTSYKKVPKEELPKYPQLQGIDLVTGCVDTMKIYEEVKAEILTQNNEMQMIM